MDDEGRDWNVVHNMPYNNTYIPYLPTRVHTHTYISNNMEYKYLYNINNINKALNYRGGGGGEGGEGEGGGKGGKGGRGKDGRRKGGKGKKR